MEKRTLPPILTYALCALSVLVTLANLTSNQASPSTWAQLGHYADGGPFDVWNGRTSLLLTSIFIHADFRQGIGVAHLLFNLIWLYLLGTRLEKSIGPLYYLGLVISAAYISSGCELAWSGMVGVGMSGVVYAIFAFMWAGKARYPGWDEVANRNNLLWLLGWLVLCFVTAHFGWLAVGNGAHLGGLIFGYSIGALLLGPADPTSTPTSESKPNILHRAMEIPLLRWLWTAPIVVQLIVCGVSTTYEPWTWQWNYYNGTKAFLAKDYAHSITWFERSVELGGPAAPAWEAVGSAWHNMSIPEYDAHNWAGFKYDLKQERDAMVRAGKPLPPPPPKKLPAKPAKAKPGAAKSPQAKAKPPVSKSPAKAKPALQTSPGPAKPAVAKFPPSKN